MLYLEIQPNIMENFPLRLILKKTTLSEMSKKEKKIWLSIRGHLDKVHPLFDYLSIHFRYGKVEFFSVSTTLPEKKFLMRDVPVLRSDKKYNVTKFPKSQRSIYFK